MRSPLLALGLLPALAAACSEAANDSVSSEAALSLPTSMCPESKPLISPDGRYALELVCFQDATSIVRLELATGERATVVKPVPVIRHAGVSPLELLASNERWFTYRVGRSIHVADWALTLDVPYDQARFVELVEDRVLVFMKASSDIFEDDWSVQTARIGKPLGPATHLSNWYPIEVSHLLNFEDDKAGVKPGNRLGGARLVRVANRDSYVLRSYTVSPIMAEIVTRLDLGADDTVEQSTVVAQGQSPYDAALVGAEDDDVYLQDNEWHLHRLHDGLRADLGEARIDRSARDHFVFFLNEAAATDPVQMVRYDGRVRIPLGKVPGHALVLDGVTPDGRFVILRTFEPYATQALPTWPTGDAFVLLDRSYDPAVITGGDVVLSSGNQRYLIDIATATKLRTLPELPAPASWTYAQPIQTSAARFFVTAQTASPDAERLFELGVDGTYRPLRTDLNRFGHVFSVGNRVYELVYSPWYAPDVHTRSPELVTL